MSAGRVSNVQAAVTEALRNWALMYPIPAWRLAEGDQAERLADNWARTAAGMVMEAIEGIGAEDALPNGRLERRGPPATGRR